MLDLFPPLCALGVAALSGSRLTRGGLSRGLQWGASVSFSLALVILLGVYGERLIPEIPSKAVWPIGDTATALIVRSD